MMRLPRMAKQIFERVVNSRLLLVILVAVLIAGFVFALARASQMREAVEYAERHPAAVPPVACPGDSFSFAVHVSIPNRDTSMRITEGWCKNTETENYCPWEFQIDPKWVNVVEDTEQSISTDVLAPLMSPLGTRAVPLDLPPGKWELRHCNASLITGHDQFVSCYAVEIEVLPPDLCK